MLVEQWSRYGERQVREEIGERSLHVFEYVVGVLCNHMYVITCIMLTFITVGLKLKGNGMLLTLVLP